MITPLTIPGLTLLFLAIVVGLGAALVWMMWELDPSVRQPAKTRPHGSRLR